MRTAAYGSWSSPVTVELMTAAAVRLGTPTLDGRDLYWTESRPDEGGRTTLLRRRDGATEELTPAPYDVRTRVHEYGGGEYAARDGLVAFSDVTDGRLHLIRPGQPPVPLTPAAPLRYADLRLHPQRGLLLAVREDHRGDGECVNTIVAVALDGLTGAGPVPVSAGAVLCSGADFYADPELGADGRLAWTEWDHPDMPWDATRILVGRLDGTAVTGTRRVTSGDPESAVHPRWTPDGRLLLVSDRSGWWNLYSWSGDELRPLHEADIECALPLWVLGQHPYAMLDDDTVLLTWTDDGVGAMGRLRLSTGELESLSPPGHAAATLTLGDGCAAAVLSGPEGPARLALLDLADGGWTEVARASEVRLDPGMLSVARAVSWSSEQGPVHGWFYPPTNADHTAPAGTLPPLMTMSHGGPTSCHLASFDLDVQYWTSRGVAVLDVNYGGSTGYGRDYRERLKGRWGLVDVADCARGAVAMGEQGLADPRRLAIQGGSAGGYTTLRALTATDVFSAGISRYGVGDLEGLARDTHKFESRYLDGLVGPYPEAAELYRDRSPVHHVDQLSAPILLLQGDEDRVVPLNQAEAVATAARAKGLPVALLVFEGEGHGFRRSENIRAALQAELFFLGRVFGFVPADPLPALTIDNLPG